MSTRTVHIDLRTSGSPRRPEETLLQLTKRSEYGLIALIHLVDRDGAFVSVREIADHYPIPRRLLAEVVKDLARAGLVESQRGALGGYTLARSAESITLGDVVVALEGAPLVTSCDSHGDASRPACDVEPVCPIRSPLQRLRESIWRLMERTTLRSLCSSGEYVALAPDFARRSFDDPQATIVHQPDTAQQADEHASLPLTARD